MNPNFSGVTANGEYARMGQANPIENIRQTPIDAATLGTQPSLQLPTRDFSSDAFNINSSIPSPTIETPENIVNETTTQTPTEKKQQSTLERIAGLIRGGKGQTELTQEAETKAGVPGISSTLNEFVTQLEGLNNQATDLQNQANYTIPNTMQERATGRGITAAGLAPITAGELRKNQIKQGAIASQSLTLKSIVFGLQGKLALAEKAAKASADAQFEAQEREIATEKAQLDAIAPTLKREEKAKLDIQTAKLEDRKREIENAKENKKTVIGFGVEASKNGAGALLVNRALQESDPVKALEILSPYMSNPLEKKAALLDLEYKQEQINKIRNEIKNDGKISNSPEEILAYAQQYASTGAIPTGLPKGTFGLVSQAAKEMPKSDGAIISNLTGVKDSKVSAGEQDDYVRLFNILKNVERLETLDKERYGGIIGGTLGKVFSDDQSNSFVATKKQIVDDMQRMQSGAALTVEEQAFYEDYLPGRFTDTGGKSNLIFQGSEEKIKDFKTFIENRLKERLAANQLSIIGFSTVDIGGQKYKVGQTTQNSKGEVGRINADGTVTLIK